MFKVFVKIGWLYVSKVELGGEFDLGEFIYIFVSKVGLESINIVVWNCYYCVEDGVVIDWFEKCNCYYC